MGNRLFTFWGRLRRDNSLSTSEGTLHNVLIPTDVDVLYTMSGFFLVEKRGKSWIIKKYLSETLVNEIVSGSRWIGNYFYLLYKYSFTISGIECMFHGSEVMFHAKCFGSRYEWKGTAGRPYLIPEINTFPFWNSGILHIIFRFPKMNCEIIYFWSVRKF